MHLAKQISAILLGMIFLISSSGFIMYKSYCSYTGNEQVSVFVQNEICNADENESISCCENRVISYRANEEAQQTAPLSSSCDCNKAEIAYLKLNDKVVNEKVKFTKVGPVLLLAVYGTVQFNLWKIEEWADFDSPYNAPPPIHNSSQEFLITIQQLKIPHNA